MMRYVNRFLIALTVLYWLGVCLVLAITYPVGHDYQQGLLTAERTAAVYTEMAFCIWLLAILTWSTAANPVAGAKVHLICNFQAWPDEWTGSRMTRSELVTLPSIGPLKEKPRISWGEEIRGGGLL